MNSRAREFFRQAVESHERGDVRNAIRSLEEGLAVDPDHPRFWALLGGEYADQDQYSAALAAFDRAIALDEQCAPAHQGRGEVLEALGKYEEAEGALQRCIELEATPARLVLLGDVQRSLDRLVEAEGSFRQALALDSMDEEAMFNLAILIRHAEPEEAETLLRRAISVDPQYGPAYAELGHLLVAQGPTEEGEVLLRESIAIDPLQPWPRIYLGNLLFLQDRDEEAIAEFAVAASLAPNLALPERLMADCYAELDDDQMAEYHFRRAAAIDSSDPHNTFALGNFLYEQGRRTEAVGWLERTLGLKPDIDLIAKVHQLLGQLG